MADFNKFIKGFEEPKEEGILGGEFNPTEEIGDYYDGWGGKTWSEKELRLMAHNDQNLLNHIMANRKALAEKAKTDPKGVYDELISKVSYKDHGIKPENIRKSFLNSVLTEGWED